MWFLVFLLLSSTSIMQGLYLQTHENNVPKQIFPALYRAQSLASLTANYIAAHHAQFPLAVLKAHVPTDVNELIREKMLKRVEEEVLPQQKLLVHANLFGRHINKIRALSFTPAGNIISGSDDTTVCWGKTTAHGCYATWRGATAIAALCALSDDDLVAVACSMGDIYVCNPGKEATPFVREHAVSVTQLLEGFDSSELISSSFDGTIKLWDVERKRSSTTFMGLTPAVLSMAKIIASRTIVSCGIEGSIVQWDKRQPRPATTLAKDHFYAEHVQAIADGHDFISTDIAKIRVWDGRMGQCREEFVSHRRYVTWVAGFNKNHEILSASANGVIKVWGVTPVLLHGHMQNFSLSGDNKVTAMATSYNDEFIAASSRDNAIKIWNVSSIRALQKSSLDTLYGMADSFVERNPLLKFPRD